ncbi:MAG: DUF87 domain-containing protein [Dehalococcoidia bacterium]|nr:DUF87 domain-containing protein [Dehalococcoidia bacterium]
MRKPEPTFEDLGPAAAARLGAVIGGSLEKGLEVRLDPDASLEDVRVGHYVAIQGQSARFFGMITDISLDALDERLAKTPPDRADSFSARVLAGTATFAVLKVVPSLMLPSPALRGSTGSPRTDSTAAPRTDSGLQPARTIPAHFAPVLKASAQDVEVVFGAEDAKHPRHFTVGTPLEMEVQVALDLGKFTERSNGVFGKSGTGKTFLTRLLLIGILQKGAATNLVFDMHNEYGWEGSSEGRDGRTVKGLKQLFPSRVAIFSLDEASSRRRKVQPDFVVEIGYSDIEPEDIVTLRETLDLTQPMLDSVQLLARRYGRGWLKEVLAEAAAEQTTRERLRELAGGIEAHESALAGLFRRLQGLAGRCPFLVPEPRDNAVQRLLDYLQRGTHVVLEFGGHSSLEAYILVANVLTRRIFDRYKKLTEERQGTGAPRPQPLMITIEEAHKFLSPELAHQTIFGTIAREGRKYNVALLVIDQRPSAIDGEVLSQVGTKIVCQLDNERDVEAVLAGASGRSELRGVLAKLDSKQQALMFGHALPMPVVVRVRDYGSPESYKSLGEPTAPAASVRDLFP